jgi:anti-anti-sigma factor
MMRRECNIKTRRTDSLVTIEVSGDLTASAEQSMDEAYRKAREYNAEKILLKFDGKSRINSAGIAIIINMVIDSQERDCKIFITGISKHFRKIFDLVGLTRFTSIVESEEEVNDL